jgi:hypothetical protein
MTRRPYGQRGPGRTWKKYRPATTAHAARDIEADMELEARKWRELAPRLGFCNGCGARIDEANGKLHDEGCIPGQPERCTPGQRS